MSEWISVEDRLPEKQSWNHIAVLDTKTGRISVEQDLYAIETAEKFKQKKGFCKDGRFNGREVVIAWMPFPEPPTSKQVTSKPIIDVCCGSKMFWFDKNNPDVEFCDKRSVERTVFYSKRYIEIKPDTVCDFTKLPFDDEQYNLVVFDPPHLIHAGEKSWLAIKYGKLDNDWKTTIAEGFAECFRVLKEHGVLIFKWSETDIPVSEILKLTPNSPLFGHKSGKAMHTHWLCFMKEVNNENSNANTTRLLR